MRINEKEALSEAIKAGFDSAAFSDVSELVFVPEYRKYCEMNTCGHYGKCNVCPPACGTPEEMKHRTMEYKRALILQTVCDFVPESGTKQTTEEMKKHNLAADGLIQTLTNGDPGSVLRISAGPWKNSSCLSAYCIDTQKTVEKVGMTCWADDGKSRFFSIILFR